MREAVKNFCVRGMMFAWGGPVVLAIVWFCLKRAGVVAVITVDEAVLGIISSCVMAFIAAGISIIYQIEKIPKAFAGLIQCAVLYIDYLGVYIMNGWISIEKTWMFTLIFLAGFAVTWFSIYIPIHVRVQKMNRMLSEKNDLL